MNTHEFGVAVLQSFISIFDLMRLIYIFFITHENHVYDLVSKIQGIVMKDASGVECEESWV